MQVASRKPARNAERYMQQIKAFDVITEEQKAAGEAQIEEKQKKTDYDIREYPVEVIVDKFTKGYAEGAAELFVPDYQRELVWSQHQKCRFIESVLLNLPIPYLFVADNEGRLEIVDGVQRIRTLVEYTSGKWPLDSLEILSSLNGHSFTDLTAVRQLRFRRKTLRMIELTERADEEARRMMFDRLNTGGTKLVSMEQRMGSRNGPYLDFIRRLSSDATFHTLCPVSEVRVKRREYEELVLRYFAYVDNYLNFEKRVDKFLDQQLDAENRRFEDNPDVSTPKEAQFRRMLEFSGSYLPNGFKKSPVQNSVPRIRFEALSVGITLALRINPDLVPQEVGRWLDSKEFEVQTRSDASNSRPRVIDRIHFVRDNLLGRPWERAAEIAEPDETYGLPF